MTIDYTVTRRIPQFGSREATTGWRPVTYNEDEEPEVIITSRGQSGFHTPAGYYGRIEYLGQCADVVNEGDQLKRDSEYYHVEYVSMVYDGDNFIRRDCALTHLPLWEAVPGTGTWSLTRLSPARKNTKELIDHATKGVRDSQLTKDDDSTEASWACIWANPPYHLCHEFRAASDPVQGLYVLGKEAKTPNVGISKTPWSYDQLVPITIMTIDSTDCTGVFLSEKMEEELEYVYRNYPQGSRRRLERVSEPRETFLGSMKLYEVEYQLHYRRAVT